MNLMKETLRIITIMAFLLYSLFAYGSDADSLVLDAKFSTSGVTITVFNKSGGVIEYADFDGRIRESIFVYKNENLYEYMDNKALQAALIGLYRPTKHEIPSGGSRTYELRYEDIALVRKGKNETKYDFTYLDEGGDEIGIAFIRGPAWHSGSENKMFHFELSRDKGIASKYPWKKE